MTGSGSAPSVALVVSTPDRRGAEVFADALAPMLALRGWSTSLVALDTAAGEHPFAAIEALGPGRRSLRTWRRLISIARSADVLVANGGTTLIPVCVAAALTRTPFVYRNIGDPTVWGQVRGAGLRLGAPMRRAARVLALYPRAATELIRRYRLQATSVVTVSNAASGERFRPATPAERTAARDLIGLAPGRSWIAYIGALSSEKRPQLAIESVLADSSLSLVVVGDGPLRDECEHLASAATDRVLFLGRRNDVDTVLQAVDVVVISSATEGIAGAAIEAGLAGLPVVTTDVGGMADLVLHDQTGVVVADPTATSLSEALHRALAYQQRYGAAARERCLAYFEFDSVADQWDRELRGLLSPSR